MKILSIIDKIYESSNFGTYLIVALVALLVLFVIVLILGIKDSKKSKEVKVEVEEDVKDITFDVPNEIDKKYEDVTFEMPSLTQNLENFKKSLEEEIQKEDMAEVRKTSGLILPKEHKNVKVLDLDKIEDTSILPITDENKILKHDEKIGSEINDLFDNSEKKKNDLEEKKLRKDILEMPIIKKDFRVATEENQNLIKDLKYNNLQNSTNSTNANSNINNIPSINKEHIDDNIFRSSEVENNNKSINNHYEEIPKMNDISHSGIYSDDDDF